MQNLGEIRSSTSASTSSVTRPKVVAASRMSSSRGSRIRGVPRKIAIKAANSAPNVFCGRRPPWGAYPVASSANSARAPVSRYTQGRELPSPKRRGPWEDWRHRAIAPAQRQAEDHFLTFDRRMAPPDTRSTVSALGCPYFAVIADAHGGADAAELPTCRGRAAWRPDRWGAKRRAVAEGRRAKPCGQAPAVGQNKPLNGAQGRMRLPNYRPAAREKRRSPSSRIRAPRCRRRLRGSRSPQAGLRARSLLGVRMPPLCDA
jgi:hypothetical protein